MPASRHMVGVCNPVRATFSVWTCSCARLWLSLAVATAAAGDVAAACGGLGVGGVAPAACLEGDDSTVSLLQSATTSGVRRQPSAAAQPGGVGHVASSCSGATCGERLNSSAGIAGMSTAQVAAAASQAVAGLRAASLPPGLGELGPEVVLLLLGSASVLLLVFITMVTYTHFNDLAAAKEPRARALDVDFGQGRYGPDAMPRTAEQMPFTTEQVQPAPSYRSPAAVAPPPCSPGSEPQVQPAPGTRSPAAEAPPPGSPGSELQVSSGIFQWPQPAEPTGPVCEELVVPRGQRMVCRMECRLHRSPQNEDFDITNVRGAPLMRVRAAELQLSPGRTANVALCRLQGDQTLATVLTQSLHQSELDPFSVGLLPPLDLVDATGVVRGCIQRKGADYHLSLGGRKAMTFSGDFRAHRLKVSGTSNRPVALVEPRSSTTCQVTIEPEADAGLVLLGLLAIDKCECQDTIDKWARWPRRAPWPSQRSGKDTQSALS